jgi:hypothetical protein
MIMPNTCFNRGKHWTPTGAAVLLLLLPTFDSIHETCMCVVLWMLAITLSSSLYATHFNKALPTGQRAAAA